MIKELFKRFDRLVLLQQSVFGLSWLLSAAIFAYLHSGKIPTEVTFLAVLGAFSSARLAGMCFNRYFDRFIDSKNPRTCNRPLPKGEISPLFCGLLGVCFLILFFTLCIYLEVASLSMGVVLLLVFYSLTKRFTTLCHMVLGFIQAFGPMLTWVVIAKEFQEPVLFLALALACTIGASDIIYACQDVVFDRREGLYSVPAKYGIEAALRVSCFLYCVSCASLLFFGYLLHLHVAYFLALVLIGGCFFLSFKIPDYDARFRFCNSVSGLILLSGALGELIWRALL
jgi:4-hydroxybenzoate polyprenyltransferase